MTLHSTVATNRKCSCRWTGFTQSATTLAAAEEKVQPLNQAETLWSYRRRIPKQLFNGDLVLGKCKVGRQMEQFKDKLKVYLKDFSINMESLTANRPEEQRSSRCVCKVRATNTKTSEQLAEMAFLTLA